MKTNQIKPKSEVIIYFNSAAALAARTLEVFSHLSRFLCFFPLGAIKGGLRLLSIMVAIPFIFSSPSFASAWYPW